MLLLYFRHAAPPQIITELPPNTVVSYNQDVVFVCSAEGYPPPIISWWHAGREVTGEIAHFKTNSTVRPSSDGRSNIKRSYFTITSVNTSMDGEVRCQADPPASETIGDLEVSADSTSTQLTTLGKHKLTQWNMLGLRMVTKISFHEPTIRFVWWL